MRPTWCTIDVSAIEKNVQMLAALVAPYPVCAVVKADGYGHGALAAAKAAIAGGATWLAVALVEEGVELRNAGINQPILLLSEPPTNAMEAVVENQLTPTIYSHAGLEAVAAAAARAGKRVEVHLGVDSGMARVGVAVDEIGEFAAAVAGYPNLSLSAVWTHAPVADEPDNPFTVAQLGQFGAAVREQAPGVGVHVANSAVAFAGLAGSSGKPVMVRYGISIYGIDPDRALAGKVDLSPALTLRSKVSFVKTIAAGTGVGYGHRWTSERTTTIATVPIGYADGVRRDLGLRGGTVLIGGVAHRIVGVVTMDQLMVDVGPDSNVVVGDDVVIIGTQGDAQILAADVATVLDTIPYEVVCAIGTRVPRKY